MAKKARELPSPTQNAGTKDGPGIQCGNPLLCATLSLLDFVHRESLCTVDETATLAVFVLPSSQVFSNEIEPIRMRALSKPPGFAHPCQSIFFDKWVTLDMRFSFLRPLLLLVALCCAPTVLLHAQTAAASVDRIANL